LEHFAQPFAQRHFLDWLRACCQPRTALDGVRRRRLNRPSNKAQVDGQQTANRAGRNTLASGRVFRSG
jgi:hypothetical protein